MIKKKGSGSKQARVSIIALYLLLFGLLRLLTLPRPFVLFHFSKSMFWRFCWPHGFSATGYITQLTLDMGLKLDQWVVGRSDVRNFWIIF